ncbi:MAG TPA: hypothetical protein VMZ30_13970 [Pyrinomonadaceae bacterium]|nr:hypothetical protein [Pyrinomonadaceae bacterium]
MAEERTLGLARARDTVETVDEQPSKEELQRRMEEARDSITNTVTEIKDNVAQQYENVKEALDWREHFKRQPLAWSLGAAGVGFFVGYGIAAAISGSTEENDYYDSPGYSVLPQRSIGDKLGNALTRQPDESIKSNGKDVGPGLLERFRETSAYDRLSQEAGALGDRLVEELSTTAQQVVLPALLKKVKNWIGLDLSARTPSMASNQKGLRSYEPAASAGEL